MTEQTRYIVQHRNRAPCVMLAVLMALSGAKLTPAVFGFQDLETRSPQLLEVLIYERINHERITRGLSFLTWASDVATVARSHSEDMAVNKYFAHANRKGELIDTRLENEGIACSIAAENIFRGINFENVVEASVQRWLKSPGHSENIFANSISETGVGIYKDENNNDYYITQVFIERALMVFPAPSRLSNGQIDAISNVVKGAIEDSKRDYHPAIVKERIMEALKSLGLSFKENVLIEGFLKDKQVLRVTADFLIGDGFIVKFAQGDQERGLEIYRRLVNPQSYSAGLLIYQADNKVEFSLIRVRESK